MEGFREAAEKRPLHRWAYDSRHGTDPPFGRMRSMAPEVATDEAKNKARTLEFAAHDPSTAGFQQLAKTIEADVRSLGKKVE